jgi:hypothetical protein
LRHLILGEIVNRLIERCAMLDVHKEQITPCVRVPDGNGGHRREVREFRTTTARLLTLADWLRSYAVTVVGMESTGVYWRAVYYLREDEFECRLYNARHLRHVPGRKSDVQAAGATNTDAVDPLPELADVGRWRPPGTDSCRRPGCATTTRSGCASCTTPARRTTWSRSSTGSPRQTQLRPRRVAARSDPPLAST